MSKKAVVGQPASLCYPLTLNFPVAYKDAAFAFKLSITSIVTYFFRLCVFLRWVPIADGGSTIWCELPAPISSGVSQPHRVKFTCTAVPTIEYKQKRRMQISQRYHYWWLKNTSKAKKEKNKMSQENAT